MPVVLLMLCAAGAFMAGAASPASAAAKVEPIVECVFHDAGTGQYIAVFGYNNPETAAKALPIGEKNNIAPQPQDRGQGTSFAPGRHTNTVIVIWNGGGDIAWNLDGNNAHATTASTACASNPVPATGAQTIVWILVGTAAVAVGGTFWAWRQRRVVKSLP